MNDAVAWREEVRSTDPEEARRLCRSSGFFNSGEIEVAGELVEERLAKGERSGYFFLWAELESRVRGYACYGPIAGTEGSFDLYWIVVDQDIRRQGLGGRLAERVARRVAEAGGRRLYVETSGREQYVPTQAFYERQGYVREAVIRDFYAPGDHKLIYVLNLETTQAARYCPGT